MFDLSFAELLVIGVVALVVLGPERLPKAARFAGVWARRARAQWQSVRSELERELAAEELKRDLDHARSAVRDAEDRMRETDTQARREATGLHDDLRATARAATGQDAPAPAAPARDDADTATEPSSPTAAAITPTDAHPDTPPADASAADTHPPEPSDATPSDVVPADVGPDDARPDDVGPDSAPTPQTPGR